MRDRFDWHVSPASLEPGPVPRLSENARWLLEQRYLVDRWDASLGATRKEAGIEELARRVARTLASAETQYLDPASPESLPWLQTLEKNIATDILCRRFLFNSPCLFSAAAGLTVRPDMSELLYGPVDAMSFDGYVRLYEARTRNQQLFACFVIDVPDSIEGIFSSVRDASVISKFGGGVGANFGRLREHGSPISGGTGGKASGPVSFMETWNTMGAVVVQGGKRRAALMGMLFDDHPDIERFVECKTEDDKLSYFNISVAVSDLLMREAERDGAFDLHSRADGRVVATLRARELLSKIAESAWKRGDPGVFFIDRAQQDNVLKMSPEWKIESTNPCGEQPLPNYTSCNLGSINVEAFVKDGTFDQAAFEGQVFRSMYYLDLVIDACSYPLERIGERTRQIRPVGLGIMGLADASILQGLVYGSPEACAWYRELAGSLARTALRATQEIVSEPLPGKSVGKDPFPEHGLVAALFDAFRREVEGDAQLFDEGTLFSDRWSDALSREEWDQLLDRMGQSDTIPRTLVSALAAFSRPGATSFDEARATLKAVVRGQMRNSRRLSIAPTGSISMILDASSGIEPNFAWSWTRRIAKVDGTGTEDRDFWHELLSPAQREELRASGRLSDPVFVTAYDIGTQQHVDVTGIFARVVDSGVSKTVNLPNAATPEDVRRVYQECYALGCKGITVYRDGSRSYQPIEIKRPEDPDAGPRKVKERPGLVVFGKTIKESTPWGSIYITLNFDGTDPFEIFINVGKSGSELKAMTEALSRVISIGLRSGSRLEDFIDTLKGLSGKEYWMFGFDEDRVARSIPDAIALLLERLVDRQDGPPAKRDGGAICPECSSPMEMISGCAYCFSCGYSPCK